MFYFNLSILITNNEESLSLSFYFEVFRRVSLVNRRSIKTIVWLDKVFTKKEIDESFSPRELKYSGLI